MTKPAEPVTSAEPPSVSEAPTPATAEAAAPDSGAQAGTKPAVEPPFRVPSGESFWKAVARFQKLR